MSIKIKYDPLLGTERVTDTKIGTPTNSSVASRLLTVGGTPSEGDTVTMGNVTYKARLDALGIGEFSSATLTFTDVPHSGDTVIFGGVTFRIFATLAQANDVLLEATTSETIDNLVSAFNGTSGSGVKYHASTTNTTRTQFLAGKGGGNVTFVVAAKVRGFASNGVGTGGTMTHSTWSGNTVGGIDPSVANDVFCTSAETFIDNLIEAVLDNGVPNVNYSGLTEVNSLVTATKSSPSTMTATNLISGAIGNDTSVAKSGTNLSWASFATKLAGGIDGTVASAGDTYIKSTKDIVYIATDDNTKETSNWRKFSITTL